MRGDDNDVSHDPTNIRTAAAPSAASTAVVVEGSVWSTVCRRWPFSFAVIRPVDVWRERFLPALDDYTIVPVVAHE